MKQSPSSHQTKLARTGAALAVVYVQLKFLLAMFSVKMPIKTLKTQEFRDVTGVMVSSFS